MNAMARAAPFRRTDQSEIPPRQRVVQGATDAPDCKGEDQALDVEPLALSELEEAWRVPVTWNVNWFREAE